MDVAVNDNWKQKSWYHDVRYWRGNAILVAYWCKSCRRLDASNKYDLIGGKAANDNSESGFGSTQPFAGIIKKKRAKVCMLQALGECIMSTSVMIRHWRRRNQHPIHAWSMNPGKCECVKKQTIVQVLPHMLGNDHGCMILKGTLMILCSNYLLHNNITPTYTASVSNVWEYVRCLQRSWHSQILALLSQNQIDKRVEMAQSQML